MKGHMTSTSLVRVLGAALLVARGMRLELARRAGRERRQLGRRPASGTAGRRRERQRRDGRHERRRRRDRRGGNGGRRRCGTGGTTVSGGGRQYGTGGATGTGGTRRQDQVGNPQCSDGIDNDGDGKIDYDDPECVGPLDNDESSFATGIPGDNIDACKQDCFFDGNSGMGDDGCDWQLKCDPQSVEPKCPYDAQYAHAARDASARCRRRSRRPASTTAASWCRTAATASAAALIPGAPTPIRLAATCTAADFGDPAKCPPCTQVTQCSNPCDHCEICIGKPTLPADCTTGDAGRAAPTARPAAQQCGSDFVPCGPGTNTPVDGCPTGTTAASPAAASRPAS